ncbi:MAG: hypothetical protein QM820_53045 [Minicystis sp.]
MADAAPRIPVAFRPRAAPLAPVAAAARDAAAVALAKRLLDRDDDALAKLSGASAAGLLLILGEADALPWVDGVVYLGRDPGAPALLLPTAIEPAVPAPLFERAVLSRGGLAAPVAVLVDPPALVSLGGARAIQRARLTAWLRAASEAS